MNKSDSEPKTHVNTVLNLPISRETLVENTKILRVENDVYGLQILEAFLTYQRNPSLNKQHTGMSRTLKLYNTQAAQHRTLEDPANLINR